MRDKIMGKLLKKVKDAPGQKVQAYIDGLQGIAGSKYLPKGSQKIIEHCADKLFKASPKEFRDWRVKVEALNAVCMVATHHPAVLDKPIV